MRGLLNGVGYSFLIYAFIALWFNVTVFAVLTVVSMLCLIQAEQIRRRQMRAEREAVWARRDNDWHGPELARCMDCGGWWSLDGLALTGGACGHCTPARAPGIGGER